MIITAAVEETIEKLIEQIVVEAEPTTEITETENLPKELIEEAEEIVAAAIIIEEEPKPEQIAETIALIEKAAEETQTNLDESLPPPPISDTAEELNLSVDVSSPIAQNSLESLPSPTLSSSQSENLPPPPPATTNEEIETTTTAAASTLPSPPLTDSVSSSLPAEKASAEEIISELPAAPIVEEVNCEVVIPAVVEVLPHVNGNGIKEEDETQQQKDKVNNPEN